MFGKYAEEEKSGNFETLDNPTTVVSTIVK